ncbi:MAG: DNA-directed RNA polymerase subunit N [Candidatus Poseidoniaceae archaeon]|jgi:DNA-directed RNA polymerase subunit N (RpoN/RPB10)|nr:DNA-directed RNA polymerase subunit N [Candidatus Poseidoniaceae archaeon]
MIIPVRCFSCGSVIADKWEAWKNHLAAGMSVSDALDEIEMMRYCCRRHFVSHVDLIDEIAPFSTAQH